MMDGSRQTTAEANRRRYDELRAAGQQLTPKGLPEPTRRDSAPIADDAVIQRLEVPGGWYTPLRLARGEALRIIDGSGHASASLIAWRMEDTSERINCADTVKVQWSAALSKGRVILSDMGRVMLSVIEDTSGAHDLMVGGSTPASTMAQFGAVTRNTRENFVAAAAKIDLAVRDIPPCVTFFAPVATDPAGRFVWHDGRKQAGDFVDLRAEMNLIVAVSNCAHPLAPAASAAADAVTLIRHRAPAAAAGDLCRTASSEAMRAFAVTDQLFV
jgi:urea carboxylase-associated protein 2